MPPAKKKKRFTFQKVAFTTTLVLAVALRIAYLGITEPTERAYDPDGHIEYIETMAKDFRLPHPSEGWEFYQPPLYYAVASIYLNTVHIFFQQEDVLRRSLQFLSFAFAMAAIAVMVALSTFLFPRKEERIARSIFLGFGLLTPGLIYFAVAINNDVLLVLLSFLCIAFLTRFWTHDEPMAWIVSWLAACAAVLTKSNGLLLIAVLGICLLLRPQLSWKKKIAGGALSVAVFVLLTGWLPIYRFAIEKDMLHAVEVTGTVGTILVTNLTNLHGGLLVDNTPLDYVTFNPRAMLEIPYNHAWLDQARRMYFPEYFYRSIFFGEHDFGMSLALLAAGMLLVGMMLFPFALLGFAHCARNLRSPRFPFVIIFLVMIAGHVAFRITSPYGPSQDFRYSPLIVIAAFAFIADATTFLPAPLRRLSIAVSVGSMILSAAFIISLPFFGPGTEGFVPFFK